MDADLCRGRDCRFDSRLGCLVSNFAAGWEARAGEILRVEAEAREGFDRSLRRHVRAGGVPSASAVSLQTIRGLVRRFPAEYRAIHRCDRGGTDVSLSARGL